MDKSADANKVNGEFFTRSENEYLNTQKLLEIAESLLPNFGPHWNAHNLVTLKRQSLSRLLYLNDLYQKIVEIPGVICEFGVHWGAGMSQLINLRGIHEPYNLSRKIVGFDTFEGFPVVNEKDGINVKVGDLSTSKNYELILEKILTLHESFCPLSHIKKFEIVKGDASETIETWLDGNQHAIISMAIFDMDIYKPTRDVLTKIIPRLTKGSLLVFDELNNEHWPGETIAVNEVLGLNNISLKRHPHQPTCAWAVFGQ